VPIKSSFVIIIILFKSGNMAHKHTNNRHTDREQRKTQYTMYTIQDVQSNTVKLIKNAHRLTH